jgi:hypothetical protein
MSVTGWVLLSLQHLDDDVMISDDRFGRRFWTAP